MMPDVARHDERQGAHGNRAVVCGTGPEPGGGVEAAHHDEIGFPQPAELLDEIRQPAAVERRPGHVLLLVEAREVGFLAAADAEGAVAKNALGVANVAEYLSCAPLPRRVAERLPIP
jgi:hypothetical protein